MLSRNHFNSRRPSGNTTDGYPQIYLCLSVAAIQDGAGAGKNVRIGRFEVENFALAFGDFINGSIGSSTRFGQT